MLTKKLCPTKSAPCIGQKRVSLPFLPDLLFREKGREKEECLEFAGRCFGRRRDQRWLETTEPPVPYRFTRKIEDLLRIEGHEIVCSSGHAEGFAVVKPIMAIGD